MSYKKVLFVSIGVTVSQRRYHVRLVFLKGKKRSIALAQGPKIIEAVSSCCFKAFSRKKTYSLKGFNLWNSNKGIESTVRIEKSRKTMLGVGSARDVPASIARAVFSAFAGN